MGVIIIREMVGTSPRSWSDAARQAVATASKTVRNIQTVEVVKSTADRRRRRDRRVPRRGQDRLRIRGLNGAAPRVAANRRGERRRAKMARMPGPKPPLTLRSSQSVSFAPPHPIAASVHRPDRWGPVAVGPGRPADAGSSAWSRWATE